MGSTAGPGPVDTKLTYADYVTLPDDGRRYEILDGELAVTPSPNTRHQRVSRNLELILQLHVAERGLGEVLDAPIDVVLDETTVVQPDLVFISSERASIVTRRAVEGAPDLVVEILSSSTADRDRGAKMKLYGKLGVKHYWLLDPDERVLELYGRAGRGLRRTSTHRDEDVVACTVPPGLELELARVWAD